MAYRGGRRRPRGGDADRASGHAPRARLGQPCRGTGRGFSGRVSPRLHVVKQDRPRVTAVLCRGPRSSYGITCPKSSSRHPGRFPAGLGERSIGNELSGREVPPSIFQRALVRAGPHVAGAPPAIPPNAAILWTREPGATERAPREGDRREGAGRQTPACRQERRRRLPLHGRLDCR